MRCLNSSRIRLVDPTISLLISLVVRCFVVLARFWWAADLRISNPHNPVFLKYGCSGVFVCVSES